MKSIIKTIGQNFLQNSKITIGVFLLSGTMLASCNKNADEAITEEDAVDVVEGTLSYSSYGITKSVEYASIIAEENAVYTETPTINCGQVYSKDTIVSAIETNFSYNYNLHNSYQLICTDAGYPQTFMYNHTMNGTYDTERMSSNDNAQSAFTITGLESANTTVTINGTYERNGTQQSKVRNQRSFGSTINYTLSNLIVSKAQQKIQSGTATLVISLFIDNITKNYTANITFLGNNSATVVINGNSYSISW